MDEIKLSILICSIEERAKKLEYLYIELRKQIVGSPVEIITATDNREQVVGAKRNDLLEAAKGEYVVFFDDDDWPDDEYVSLILKALKINPDCVGITGLIYFANKQEPIKFIHSIQCSGWYAGSDAFYRTPNHLNPVKRDLALKTLFDASLTIGEDKDYSERLRPLLVTESFIEKPIYNYYSRDILQ